MTNPVKRAAPTMGRSTPVQFGAIVPFLAGFGLVAHSIYSFLRALRTPSIPIQRMRSTSVNGPEGYFWRFKFVTEKRYVTPQARRPLHITATVLIVLGVLCFTLILTGLLSHSGIASWNKPVAQWMYAHRSPDVNRPGFCAVFFFWKDSVVPDRYPLEVRKRATRIALDRLPDYPSP